MGNSRSVVERPVMPIAAETLDVETAPEQGSSEQESNSRRYPTLLARFVRATVSRKSKKSQTEVQREGLDSWWLDRTTPVVREIRNNPHGWPRLSAAIDSEPNLMIFRRFGYLHTRLLTYHQDVLREMEESLDNLDWDDYHNQDTKRAMCWRQGDDQRDPPRRKELLQDIEKELKIYDELLFRSQRMYAFEEPSKRNQQSVTNMIWNDASLAIKDRDYIRHEDDLITLASDKETSWVHTVVGLFFRRAGERITRLLFRDDIQQKKAVGTPLGLELFQRVKFNQGVEYLFAIFSIITLIGPIYILNKIQNANEYLQNTAVFISTALFAFLLSSATAAKRHEVFAVTSAYCAVLVVFTSQNSNNNNHSTNQNFNSTRTSS